MLNLSRFTKSFVKSTKGTYHGTPRIYNVDQDKHIYGYAEINDQATSPFSRIKVHKGLFTCSKTDVLPGDLIQDKADGNKYIVMSIKDKYCGDASVYFDCALYYCNTSATVYRFSTDPVRDTFGRVVLNTPVEIFKDIPIMTDPKNFAVDSLPDRLVESDKINVYIQSKYAVTEADRIVTPTGDVYMIEVIDKGTLDNIWICKVNKDDR